MLDSPQFRTVLHRLAQTREPVQPDATEEPVFNWLFGRQLIGYVWNAHQEGYVITADGRDLVSPHRQGAMP